MAMGSRPKSVDAYLAGIAPDKRAALEKLRKTIRAAAPKAEEGISYQMPAFKLNGRSLVGYAAFAKHCSFFPMSSTVMDAHRGDLARYDTTKGTVHFPPDKPLPATLVRKIVKARIAEIEATVAARASRRRAK